MDWKFLILCIGCFSLLCAASVLDKKNSSSEISSIYNDTKGESDEHSKEKGYVLKKIEQLTKLKDDDDSTNDTETSSETPRKKRVSEYQPQPPAPYAPDAPPPMISMYPPAPPPPPPMAYPPPPPPPDYYPPSEHHPAPPPRHHPHRPKQLCPPEAPSCPLCISSIYELPKDICRYPLVLKVLLLGPPSVDSYGKVCGKFGVQEVYGPVNVNEFRRLFRFSLNSACLSCKLSPSREYMLITDFSGFTKDGSLYNAVALSHQSVLLSVDRYTKQEILSYLRNCFTPSPPPEIYHPPPVYPPPPPTYAPPPPPTYAPPPPPPPTYAPPPPPPPTYAPPPPPPTYAPPPPPPTYAPPPPPPTYAPPPPPPTYVPPPPSPTYEKWSHPTPPPYIPPPPPFPLQEVKSTCLTHHYVSCPVCAELNTVNINETYCKSDFALLAAIYGHEIPYQKYGAEVHEFPECSKLSTKVLFDVSKGKNPKHLGLKLDLLLPALCQCLPASKGPAIVMILGKNTPTPAPPVAQLSKEFTVVLIPAPITVILPSCTKFDTYPPPVIPPQPPYRPYSTTNCPAGYLNSCPICANVMEKTFLPLFCSARFVAIVSVAPKGPVVYGPIKTVAFPEVSVTNRTYYNEKSLTITIGVPPEPNCEEGSLMIERMIEPAYNPYLFGNHVTYFVLSTCSCPLLLTLAPTTISGPREYQENIPHTITMPPPACTRPVMVTAGAKLLLFSKMLPHMIDYNTIQLTNKYVLVPLRPDGSLPSCKSPTYPGYPQPPPSPLPHYQAPPPPTPPIYKPPLPPAYPPPAPPVYKPPPPPAYPPPAPPVYKPPPPPAYLPPAAPVYMPPPPAYPPPGPPTYKPPPPPTYLPPPPPVYKSPPPTYPPPAPPAHKPPPPPAYLPPAAPVYMPPPPAYPPPAPPVYKPPPPHAYPPSAPPVNKPPPPPAYPPPAAPVYMPPPPAYPPPAPPVYKPHPPPAYPPPAPSIYKHPPPAYPPPAPPVYKPHPTPVYPPPAPPVYKPHPPPAYPPPAPPVNKPPQPPAYPPPAPPVYKTPPPPTYPPPAPPVYKPPPPPTYPPPAPPVYKPPPPPTYPPPAPPVYKPPPPPTYPPPPPTYPPPAPPVYKAPPPPAYLPPASPVYMPPPPAYPPPAPPAYKPPPHPVYPLPAPPAYKPHPAPPAYKEPPPPEYKPPPHPVYLPPAAPVYMPTPPPPPPPYKAPPPPAPSPYKAPPAPAPPQHWPSPPVSPPYPPPYTVGDDPSLSRIPDECPIQQDLSCPICVRWLPDYMYDIFCEYNFAMLVALGVNKDMEFENQTIVPFNKSKSPNVDVKVEETNYIIKVKVTDKNESPKTNTYDYNRKCIKETVHGLHDISYLNEMPKPIDVFIPAHCKCEVLNKAPSYAVILSTNTIHLQYQETNLQLNEDFVFFILPDGTTQLPVCPPAATKLHYLPRYPQPMASYRSPKTDLEYVECSYPSDCGTCEVNSYQDLGNTFCDMKFAILVEVIDSSSGSSSGPNLDIFITKDGYGGNLLLENRKENYDDSSNSYGQEKNCKQVTIKPTMDFKGTLSGTFTFYAKSSCQCELFENAHYALIMSKTKPEITYNSIEFSPDMTIILLSKPGELTLPVCPKTIPEKSTSKPPTEITTEPSTGIPTPSLQECPNLSEASCPLCGNTFDLDTNYEDYCNSNKAFLVRTTEVQNDDYTGCRSGNMFSMYDVSPQNEAKQAVLNIMYMIHNSCECPLLEDIGFVLVLFKDPVPRSSSMNIVLSDAISLYTITSGKLTLPFCGPEEEYSMRTKNAPKSISLDPVHNEVSVLWRKNMKQYECPTSSKKCPSCNEMFDDELIELICSSDNAFLVTTKENKKRTTELPRKSLNVTQDIENKMLEISIKRDDNPCWQSLKEGKCDESEERYYYDDFDKTCRSFTYTGCSGNENNFKTLEECEAVCGHAHYCDAGSFEVKKYKVVNDTTMKPSDKKYDYTIPSDCLCSFLHEGDQYAYVIYNNTAEKFSKGQLTEDHFIVPLKKKQKNTLIECHPQTDKSDSGDEISEEEDEDNGSTDLDDTGNKKG